jgi:hypothetical protein
LRLPAGASIRKAAQLLPLAAVHPESVTARCTLGQAKSIALLLRWREAAMARSSCHMKGEVGPLLRGALERAGAMPIRPPLSPQQLKKLKQRRSSLQEKGTGQTGETGQSNKGARQQQGEDDAAAWSGGLEDEDEEEAAAAGGVAGQQRKQRRKLAGRSRVLRDAADMSCSGSESDSESGGKASSSEEDEGDGGGRLKRNKQQQGRGGSARASAAAAKQKGRVGDLLAVKQAGSSQEKRRAVQQHLQHMGVKGDAAAAAAAGGAADSDVSDEEGAGAGGGLSRSEAAAAAAAAKASAAEKIDVMWRDYKSRVPATEAAFSADLQRWAGERNVEIKLGKVGGACTLPVPGNFICTTLKTPTIIWYQYLRLSPTTLVLLVQG